LALTQRRVDQGARGDEGRDGRAGKLMVEILGLGVCPKPGFFHIVVA
jgi:hypothetical protein